MLSKNLDATSDVVNYMKQFFPLGIFLQGFAGLSTACAAGLSPEIHGKASVFRRD
jgi:hypothetical protein